MDVSLGFRFTWYGHSCVAVETEAGRRLLFDPWFGNPGSPRSVEAVDGCDVMLVSHGHHDHLGGTIGALGSSDAVAIARRTAPDWPAIHELSLWLGRVMTRFGAPGRAETNVIGMNKGGTVEVRGLRVTMVHADHSAGDWTEDTGLYLGEPVGFIVELESGRRFYFAGDTDVFGDMALIGQLHRPELGFLPIGGHYTMGPQRAAHAAGLLGLRAVVPIHYGTFPILAGTPQQLRAELDALGLTEVRVIAPEPGQPVG